MNTLQWNKPKEWLETVKKIIINLWGNNFIEELKINNVTPNLFDDDWLNSIVPLKENTHYSISPLEYFAKAIKSNWAHIKVYHACRAKDINDYYSNGIASSTIEDLDRLVLNTLHPFVERNKLEKLIRIMHDHYNESDEKVFVAIDKYHLQLSCGHHLEYGSEYLLSSIMLLENFGISIQPILASIKDSTETTPTIFECDIPNNSISSDDFSELSLILLTEGCKMLLEGNYYPPSRRTGFAVGSIIKPSWIKNHKHPSISSKIKTTPPIWLDTLLKINDE